MSKEEARNRLDESIVNLQWIVEHPLVFVPRLTHEDYAEIANACGKLIDTRRRMNKYLLPNEEGERITHESR